MAKLKKHKCPPLEPGEMLHEFLRHLADQMDEGLWEDQEAAVLITRDGEGYLTFCGWGRWGNLIEQAATTRRTAA
jgi:hypothetical protein